MLWYEYKERKESRIIMECKHSSSQNVKNYHFPFDSMKSTNAAISTKKKKNKDIHKKMYDIEIE